MRTMWNHLTRRLSSRLAAFRRDRSGNVAITFAIATLPMVGAVGYAVDYSHANNVKAAMQAALDSTALMLARDAPNLSNTELNSKALTYFTALFNRPEAKNITINASYTTTSGSKIVVDGSATVPTTFLGVIGYDNVDIGGSSTAAWGSSRLRVALALDNTGSMASDGKMTALKAATKSLLTQIKDSASQNGDVYVSIIPFSKDVNVGSGNYNANWINWSDWDDNNLVCKGWNKHGQCNSWEKANHNTWNGCITDRGPSNAPGNSTWDQVVTLPNNTANSKWPAEQYPACPVAMKGLTYDWAALDSLVDSMVPNGSTNQPIGLVWAWQSLVGGGPLTAPPKNSNYQYHDIIVLMSDGLNTQNRWFGNGFQTSTPVDNRMYQTGNGSGTCANIKASGVTIYTIQVNTSGDPTSELLKNCAGTKQKIYDPSKYYMVTTANGLAKVFTEIGSELTQLRVAK